MKKKRIIDGVQYYAKANPQEGIKCTRCRKVITSKQINTTIDGSRCLCSFCYAKLATESNEKLIKSAVPLKNGDTIYVGATYSHGCAEGSGYQDIYVAYENPAGRLTRIPAKRCLNCRAIVIRGNIYEKHSVGLRDCRCISTRTMREIMPIVKSSNFRHSGSVPKANPEQIPESVVWASMHPYQGGSCSGK